jgi:LysR family hydrogen peroxide-inducible transcriptional activator
VAEPNDLSIRQLQYVVAVAELRGFRKASEACHVSQPTLSAQVQKVEEVLGVVLFERDSRQVLVTEAGEAVVAKAKVALAAVREVLAEATRTKNPFEGTFRVGIIPTIASYLLPEVTPKLAARFPHLRLMFFEERTPDLVAALKQGRIDLGVLALEADLGDLERIAVSGDAFVLALPRGHALAKKRVVRVEDLEGESVLLLEDGHCLRDQVLAACSHVGVEESSFRATSLGTLAQMVSAGMGVTLLPEMAVDVENRRGQLDIRLFAQPAPTRTVGLVWRRGSPFAQAFRELAPYFSVKPSSPRHRKSSP